MGSRKRTELTTEPVVAWMQRSEIRDQWHEFPDFATLHPGYSSGLEVSSERLGSGAWQEVFFKLGLPFLHKV